MELNAKNTSLTNQLKIKLKEFKQEVTSLKTELFSSKIEMEELLLNKNPLNEVNKEILKCLDAALQNEKCLQKELNVSNEQNSELLIEMKSMNIVIKERGEKNSKIQNEIENLNCSISDLKNENKILEEKIGNLNKTIDEKNDMIQKLEESLKASKTSKEIDTKQKQEIEGLLSTNATLLKSVEKLEETVSNTKEQLEEEANLVGKFKNEIQVLEKKLEDCSTRKSSGDADSESLSKQLKEAFNKIEVLEKEKASIRNEIYDSRKRDEDTQSEAMSTSTLSKADESNRFKELDSSFEEENKKLKMYALRQKKKLLELVKELDVKRKENSNLMSEKEQFQQEKEKLSVHKKNLNSYISANDKLQDEIDTLKSEKKKIKIELDSAVELNSKSKEELIQVQEAKENLLLDIDTLKKENTDLAKDKMLLEDKIIHLEEKNKTLGSELDALQIQINTLNIKLTDEMEKHKSTTNQLEQVTQVSLHYTLHL